jgi:hypothetical protein
LILLLDFISPYCVFLFSSFARLEPRVDFGLPDLLFPIASKERAMDDIEVVVEYLTFQCPNVVIRQNGNTIRFSLQKVNQLRRRLKECKEEAKIEAEVSKEIDKVLWSPEAIQKLRAADADLIQRLLEEKNKEKGQ